MRLYTNDTILVMELKNPAATSSPAHLESVTAQNVEDALSFQSAQQIKTFRKFLQAGDKGYYGYVDKVCVHRSWVVVKPSPVELHKFSTMPLKSGEVFIQYCETSPTVRGRNIFTHALSHIGQIFSDRRVLTSVDLRNTSSQKSMHKAGFVEVDRKHIKVFLGIKFIR